MEKKDIVIGAKYKILFYDKYQEVTAVGFTSSGRVRYEYDNWGSIIRSHANPDRFYPIEPVDSKPVQTDTITVQSLVDCNTVTIRKSEVLSVHTHKLHASFQFVTEINTQSGKFEILSDDASGALRIHKYIIEEVFGSVDVIDEPC